MENAKNTVKLSHIVFLSKHGLCMLYAQPLVAFVGTYNVV